MLRRSALFIMILLLLPISTGWAETAVGLYEAEIPVENQSAEVRRQAVRDALEEVLDKVARSSHEAAPENTLLDRALRQAERYIQQYRYTELGLWVRFDSRAVDELLQQGLNSSGTLLPIEDFLLKVTGIGSLTDYIGVTRYLGSLDSLQNIQPRVVTPDSTLFQIHARGGETTILQRLVNDGVLQRMEEASTPSSFHYTR